MSDQLAHIADRSPDPGRLTRDINLVVSRKITRARQAPGTRSVSGLAGGTRGLFSSGSGAAGPGSAHEVNAAWNALTYVREPELSLDVVSLGMIYDVRAENRIVVEMADTGLRGAARASLPGLAQTAVAEAVGGAPVERCTWYGIRPGAPR